VLERTGELEKSNLELRESEHQLRLLLEIIPQQIWSATPDGSIDSCNQRLLDYVGRSMDAMRGQGFFETVHAEDREEFWRLFRNALSTGTVFEGEWRVQGADGQYRWFFTRCVPLKDREHRVLRWYATNTDIEERRQAEHALMRAQADLAHLSRVLSMGELTSSIAHEISQPLTAVVSHGQACLEWLNADPPNVDKARQTAERIVQDGTRAGAVLGRIRAAYRKDAPEKCRLNLNEVIQEMIVFLREDSIRRHISLRTDLAPNLPTVNGDRVQLQQVMLNLIMNGMDAMAGSAEPNELLVRSREDNGTSVLISVEDNGAGISPSVEEKMFEPFFTTKARGIGMGLTISRSIVEAHEGRLWASPRGAGGTTLQFTLPICAKASGE
jgi:PAS domain S-box-containing protein